MQDGSEAETVLTVGTLSMSLFSPVHAIKFFEARKLSGVYASGLRLS